MKDLEEMYLDAFFARVDAGELIIPIEGYDVEHQAEHQADGDPEDAGAKVKLEQN
jgi:hypothetical protein